MRLKLPLQNTLRKRIFAGTDVSDSPAQQTVTANNGSQCTYTYYFTCLAEKASGERGVCLKLPSSWGPKQLGFFNSQLLRKTPPMKATAAFLRQTRLHRAPAPNTTERFRAKIKPAVKPRGVGAGYCPPKAISLVQLSR